MKAADYTTTLLLDQTPEEAFNAINNVQAWWSGDMEGSTGKLNGVFTVRFGEVYITMEVVEHTPCKKIVWQVIDCNKPWLKDTKEWNGTRISFEISKKDSKTQIVFTHLGLVEVLECFDVCSNAWSGYIQQSLFSLIAHGNGKPAPMKKAGK